MSCHTFVHIIECMKCINDITLSLIHFYFALVSKVQTQIGNTMNISWTAAFFPRAGQYLVYHTYRENRSIFSVRSNGVSYRGNNQSTKYTYLTRPFASTNIMFAIRDITLDDAGYYNGGTSSEASWSGGGVLLVVNGKLRLCYELRMLFTLCLTS